MVLNRTSVGPRLYLLIVNQEDRRNVVLLLLGNNSSLKGNMLILVTGL